MEPINEFRVIRIIGDTYSEVDDVIATETAFTLIVNGDVLVSLLCTPSELEYMAIGFLFSEGILAGKDSLKEVSVDEKSSTVRVTLDDLPDDWENIFHRKTITSGCGKGITFTDPSTLVSAKKNQNAVHLTTVGVRELLALFRNQSQLYRDTGGVHSAALADSNNILLFAEDIGRHNAVDKLIGKAIMAGIDLTDKMLLSSGRISGEIMTKVIRSKIPILITRTAPTCMSITYAENYGVTLIGFARGNRMNLYTHPLGVVFDNLITKEVTEVNAS